VKAAALTGFRLQAFREALVSDFDAAHGTLNIKKDKARAGATLSSAAIAFFKEQAKDKLPSAYLFLRADGLQWGVSHQHRPFRAACAAVNADASVQKAARVHANSFSTACGTTSSRALLAGVNVRRARQECWHVGGDDLSHYASGSGLTCAPCLIGGGRMTQLKTVARAFEVAAQADRGKRHPPQIW